MDFSKQPIRTWPKRSAADLNPFARLGSSQEAPDGAASYIFRMISISITAEAYRAIKATLPDGADLLPPQHDGRGGVRIWLAAEFVNRLGALRGHGESYSEVILRLARADP